MVSDNPQTTVLAIQAKHCNGGFYIAMLPDDLDATLIDDALRHADIEPQIVCEVNNWRESSHGVKVAFLPFPKSN